MNLNLNVTLSLMFNNKMTDKEQDVALNALERAIDRLRSKYGQSVPVIINNSSNEVTARNRSFLAQMGRQRTPKCTEKEFTIRTKLVSEEINWEDLESRYKALLPHGLNIFDRTASPDDVAGETFNGQVNPDEVPE